MPAVRIFVSALPEGAGLEELLAAETSAAVAVEWVAMPPNRPVDGAWRMACRALVLGCHGMIAVVNAGTAESEQQAWAIRCCKAGRRPLLLMLAEGAVLPEELPPVIEDHEIADWSGAEIRRFLAAF